MGSIDDISAKSKDCHALESHAYLPLIEADIEDAKGLGLTGTPTFFINGKKGAKGNM